MKELTTGQRIASRRKLANLSQEDISQELGVSRQAVSKWESDGGLPDIDNLIKLSRIFGVSVGWLLGTEADPSFDPSTGLSDAQLKMVEEIIVRNAPKSHKGWIAGAMAVCILALSLFGIFFQRQLRALSAENYAAQQQIAALEAGNQTLLQQMDTMNQAMTQQAREDDLLLNVYPKAYLKENGNTSLYPSSYMEEDGQTVVLDFYFVPKLFQENAQAYLIVTNDEHMIFETIACEVTGNWYTCRVELPVCNGYRYSFLLTTGSGYQEQSLDDVSFVRYFNNLYDATRYHLDPSGQARSVWYATDRQYSFTQPIGSPLISLRSPYVGYAAVDVTLSLNGEAIHTQSLREAFKTYGGAYMRFEEPYPLDFGCDLPELAAGDVLTLSISARTYDGLVLSAALETLVVTE